MTRSERNAHSLFSLASITVLLLLCWMLGKRFPRGLSETGSAALLFFLIAFGLNALVHYGKTVGALLSGRLRRKELGIPTWVFLLAATAGFACLLFGLLLWVASPDLGNFRN